MDRSNILFFLSLGKAELLGKTQAEVVVAVVGRVVVPIRNATVPRVVVPTANTVHAVRATTNIVLHRIIFVSTHQHEPFLQKQKGKSLYLQSPFLASYLTNNTYPHQKSYAKTA